MARYLVLKDRCAATGDEVTFIRDGFHAFAFALPVIWLLWNRLSLRAALMFAAMGLAAAVLHALVPIAAPAITGILNFGFGLLTALEGSAWLLAEREKNGASMQTVILARNLRDAEEIYAAGMPVEAFVPRAASRSFQPVSQASLIPLTGA